MQIHIYIYIIFPQFLKNKSMTLWNLQDIEGRLSLLWDHKNWFIPFPITLNFVSSKYLDLLHNYPALVRSITGIFATDRCVFTCINHELEYQDRALDDVFQV